MRINKYALFTFVFVAFGLYSFGQTCTPFVYQANGLVHKATTNNPLKIYAFNTLFPAVFNNTSFLTKITLEIDVKHGGWQPDTMNNNVNNGTLGSRHCIFLMTRNRYISNTFGQLMFRGPNKNNFHMEHNIDNNPTEYSGPVNSWNAYQAGDTYRFHYVYDARNDQVQLKIYDITGALINNPQLVRTVTDTTTLDKVPPCNRQNTVNNKDNDPDGFEVQFGFPNTRVYGYEQWVPTYGWEYSNFKLTVENECSTVTPNAGPNKQICKGTGTMLNGSGGTAYSWSPTQGLSNPTISNPIANPSVTTTYTVTVTKAVDVMVCTGIDSVKVTVNNSAAVSAGNDVSICPGESTSLNGSGAATYTWTANPTLSNTAIANPVATPVATSTYILTGSNGTCSDKDTVVVTLHAAPSANAGADISICAGDSAALQATGGNSFAWSPPLGLSATNIFDPTAFPQNPTTYSVTVTNSLGCTDTDDVLVDVSSLPIANAGADISICSGDSIALQATGGSSFSWSPPAGLSAVNISNPVASPLNATPYTVVVSNALGCSDADTITVFINASPLVNAGNDVSVCPGSSATLTGSGVTNYAWNADASLSDTSISSPVASPVVTTTYILTGSNGNCAGKDTVVVSLHAVPTANAGADVSICMNDSVTLQATGGSGFSWSPSLGLNATNVFNPSAFPQNPTTYTVIVTNSFGCTDADDVAIGVWLLPVVSVGADQTICLSSSTTLSSSGTFVSYNWSNGGNTSSITVNSAGIYSLLVADANGCKNSDTLIVSYFDFPDAADDNVSVDENGNVSFNVLGNDTYGNAGAGIISGPTNGTATIGADGSIYYTPNVDYSGTDVITYSICDSACTLHCDTAVLTIEVIDDKVVVIPEGFSPNGDGINDFFVIEGLSSFPENELVIVNRWGDVVYKASPYRNDWNGESRQHPMKLGGEIVLDGTYFYSLRLDKNTTKTGYVILHR